MCHRIADDYYTSITIATAILLLLQVFWLLILRLQLIAIAIIAIVMLAWLKAPYCSF